MRLITPVSLGPAAEVSMHGGTINVMRKLQLTAKRGIDISLSLLALIILSPVMLAVAVLIRVRLGSGVVFRQQRIGSNGKVFQITKFRSMTDVTAPDGTPLVDMHRLTPLGIRLRRLSIDELPELLDVLRGKMSLVGPRPLPVRYRDRYNSTQWRRHEMRPGITGWAQVNGRNAQSWTERFESDVSYVDNWSLRLDWKIMARTVGWVLRRRGVSAPGHATMPEFPKNKDEQP